MKRKRQMNRGAAPGGWERPSRCAGGFTLIELLVVIAVIGLLAALVIPLSSVATTKMRLARVTSELNNLVTGIEGYKLEIGEYPPDNGNLININKRNEPQRYQTNAAMSPLYYELTGATFTNTSPTAGEFVVKGGDQRVTPSDLDTYFERSGIRNSSRQRADIPFKGFSFRDSQYSELAIPGKNLAILTVPVPGAETNLLSGRIEGTANTAKKVNPWFYDASTTNRNNLKSFDLWAEIMIGDQKHIIGNWKTQ